MLKLARKQSSDPIQEKLRESKAIWNKEVSSFVNDLIHFKKLMNGWPNKFHMEKSFIKEEIPSDPTTIIGSLAGDFDNIAEKGNSIINQQIEYSKIRKKKEFKQLNLPLKSNAPTSSTDLSKQLSFPSIAALEAKYYLVAEGSNSISRFFTRLLTPTIGVSEAARIRKYRMTLLGSVLKTWKDMDKFQVEIVGSSKDSISNSNKLLHQTFNDWMLAYRGFTTYKSNMPDMVLDSGGVIVSPEKELNEDQEENKNNSPTAIMPGDYDYVPPDGEKTENNSLNEDKINKTTPKTSNEVKREANKIVKDFTSIQNKRNLLVENMPTGNDLFDPLINAIELFIMDTTSSNRAIKLIDTWNTIINVLNGFHSANANSLFSMLQLITLRQKEKNQKEKDKAQIKRSITNNYSYQIEVLAQAFLKKWLGKSRHQLSLFDKTSAFRLDIYKMSTDVRKILNEIMDSLEKDMNLKELMPLFIEANRKINSIRSMMRALQLSLPNMKSEK